MTKQEIFELEASNDEYIHLFWEGSFLVAYEMSAYRFVHSLKNYKVRKKWVRVAGLEMVSLGVPASVVNEITKELERTEGPGKRITLKAPERFTREEFEAWKEGIPMLIKRGKHEIPLFFGKNERQSENFNPRESIIDKIRNFDAAHKTPIECMLFVSELKKRVEY